MIFFIIFFIYNKILYIMPTIQFMSDLHIEYDSNICPDPLDYIIPKSDILILAGDIGSIYKIEQLKEFLTKLSIYFKVVIYVLGNHEYYKISTDKNYLMMDNLLNILYINTKHIKNLYILERNSIKIDNLCILGCTLWSRPFIKLPNYIVKIHNMDTNYYLQKHQSDLLYIKKMIKYCKHNNYKLIIVTHYCPTFKVFDGHHKHQKYHSLYASHLDYLLNKDLVNTWICGHTHKNFNFISDGGTHIISNQYGKPKDNIDDFNKSFVLEL
jgi:predicted phosphohydrolase